MAVFLLHHLLSLIYCVTFVSSMRRGFGQTYDQTYDQTHDQTYDQISDQTSDQGHILSPIHDQPEQENNILDDNFGSTRTNVGESARFSIDFNKEMKYEDFSDTDSSNAYTIELQNTLGRSVSRRGAKKAAGSSRQNHGEGYGNEASHGGTTYEHLGQGLHGLYPGYQSPFPETLKLIQASLNNQTQRAGHGLGAPGTNQYRLRHQRQRGLPKPQVVNSGGCRGRGKCTIM
ncbi:hypothetical protein ACQ4LE_003689 [Meloidogyne hapla]